MLFWSIIWAPFAYKDKKWVKICAKNRDFGHEFRGSAHIREKTGSKVGSHFSSILVIKFYPNRI